jgi:hypothetical protein
MCCRRCKVFISAAAVRLVTEDGGARWQKSNPIDEHEEE